MANEEANNIISTIIDDYSSDEDQMINQLQLQQENYEYDVFLCFYGNDTRFQFTSTLHDALRLKRFKIFIDEGAFKRGDLMLLDTFLKAVEVSRISIVVFSKNFLTSMDRLEELTKIVDMCNIYQHDRRILPVFYGVDPSSYTRHAAFTGREDTEELQRWKSALHRAACTCGYIFNRNGSFEYKLIENIVQTVEEHLPGRYNIFLSFSESTQYSFTNYLCDALDQEGFKTFRRDRKCWYENVPFQSSEAIAKSKLSIIIFCENYANSMSRLDELVTIIDSMKTNNQLVWPIFYKVEPSNIRHQKMSYAEAMIEHEKNLKNELC